MNVGVMGAPVAAQASGAPMPKRKLKLPWKMAVRITVCKWMLTFVAKHGKELLVKFVMEKAAEMAVGATMASLDREGLAHCYRCPVRFPLRKVGRGTYACQTHSQEVKAANA